MALFSIPGIRMAGIAATVPLNEAHNNALDFLDAAEKSAFKKTVGIESRRIAPADICASDLCISAARKLMTMAALPPASIGALVFVTQTPDYLLPGNSMLVQHRLGLSSSTLLLDINQGCAGYVYGLSALASLMHTARIDKGLLLVGDTITHLLSPKDRSTLPIFSDAGTATLLERTPEANTLYFHLGAEGKGSRVIRVKGGGGRHPFDEESLQMAEETPGVCRAPIHLAMRGVDVLHYALRYVGPNIRALLDFAQLSPDEPDYFVFHQANRILNESLLKKMSIPADKAPETLSAFGNTSSATIPLTMVYRLGNILSKKNCKMLLSGFGVGFSWGSAFLEAGPLFCPELIEINAADEK